MKTRSKVEGKDYGKRIVLKLHRVLRSVQGLRFTNSVTVFQQEIYAVCVAPMKTIPKH